MSQPKKYDAHGQRMTDCCGTFSTFGDDVGLHNLDSVELCCKKCWGLVGMGEGDGTEFRDGVTQEQWSEAFFASIGG
jgi:hypothetical protein